LEPIAGARDRNPGRDDLAILVRLFRSHGIGQRAYPLAVHLLRQTGSLGRLMSCTSERLRQLGVLERELDALALVGEAMTVALKRRAEERPVFASYAAVVDYLHAGMAQLRHEEFRVLFLNGRNVLIHDEVMFRGTVGRVAVYPREIIVRALETGASALILVHNHPAGLAEPSREDIQITQRIQSACREVDIILHDHLIMSSSGHQSMRAKNLL
jgi:DNA repair protein RadC